MRATFEPTEGVIRVHPDDVATHFDWSCSVTLTPDGVAWFRGLKGTMTTSIWRAVHKKLIDMGMKHAAWLRWDEENSCFRTVILPVLPNAPMPVLKFLSQ